MGANIDKPGMDVRQSVRVGFYFGLAQQRGALRVGGQNLFQQRLRPARRLLRDAADPPTLGQPDRSLIGRQLAANCAEQGRLAGSVAADQPDLGLVGDGHARPL
jgi:hypothetical protein